MSSGYEISLVFGFLCVVLLLEGAYLLWSDTMNPEVKRVQQRLRLISIGELAHGDSDVSLLKQRVMSHFPRLNKQLMRLPVLHQLDRLLLQSGSKMTAAHLLAICVIFGSGGFLLGAVLRFPGAWAVIVGAAFALLPVLRLPWMRARRLSQIGLQLPEALDLISRALRAGHGFSAALAMVGNEAQVPISAVFKTTVDEINFGISTKSALLNLATRVPTPDMRYFVMAVLIQLETGGNLAELLTMLGGLIRARYKLFGNIKTLAAEGKLSAYILVTLPFFLAGMLQIINPGYMDILFSDPMGLRLVYGALIMMVFGIFVMWRIIKIHI